MVGKKLSVIIPVYNEWRTICELLSRLLVLQLEMEIIVVDDGSSDGTSEILDSFHHPRVKLIRHPKNRGKGAAIRVALPHCSGDVVIIQDADLEQDPNDIYDIVKPIFEEGAQVVYGSRFLGQRPKMHWVAYLANIFLSRLTSFLFSRRVTDLETCYKAFTREVIQSLPLDSSGFEFEAEVTAKLLTRGIQIHEVPIKEDWYHGYRNNSKKVSWLDGVKAIFTLFKYRLTE